MIDNQQPDALGRALAPFDNASSLEAMVVHRSETLTLLAARAPVGFASGVHEHKLWAVVGVYEG